MNLMSSREAFETHIADELGHTIAWVRNQRKVTSDGYYSEYVEVPYRTWKACLRYTELKQLVML